MQLHDTLSKTTKTLPQSVTWYTCGPTVYDHAHIGHARTYLTVDSIRKAMTELLGMRVQLAMNITDIDDKIIQKCGSNDPVAVREYAQHWEQEFFKDCGALGITAPDSVVRVSESIQDIIDYITKLIQKGFARVTPEGDVVFNYSEFTREFPNVPSFANGCCDPESADFALWKANRGGYSSPWSIGRPGWHIECSAMIYKLFGESGVTIHSGGCDLKFPHHENEMLQCYALTGRDLSQVWFHTGHLNIQGCKMSKSLKNFITVKDALAQYSARVLRLYFMTHKWQSDLDYSDSGLQESKQLDSVIQDYINWIPYTDCEFLSEQKFTNSVKEFLLDNFNFSGMFRMIHDTVKHRTVHPNTVYSVLTKLGFGYTCDANNRQDQVLDLLIQFRTNVRNLCKQKASYSELFKLCDKLRDVDLKQIGINIDDK